MNSYFKAKLYLFEKILKKKTIISDSSLKEFSTLKKLQKRKLNLIDTYSLKRLEKNSKLNLNDFQLNNLSMAITAAKLCNLKEDKIFKSLDRIKDVSGRLELVRVFPNNIKVYVDFAHTPDALQKTLDALKKKYNNNISLVFGCGGDRDFKKRPLMGKIASSNCKKIYITDDNPRSESPEKIRKEIIKNIKNKLFFNIGKRDLAIKKAILNADPNETILVAGKGHEEEQVYKNKVISISDKQIIKNLKLKLKILSNTTQTFLENKNFKKYKSRLQSKNFSWLAIDSREVKKNNLFLTIKGKNNDGFEFISKALKRVQNMLFHQKKFENIKNKIIKVDNEINFLNKFASKKRKIPQLKF